MGTVLEIFLGLGTGKCWELMLCSWRGLSVSKNSLRQSPEHWWDTPTPTPVRVSRYVGTHALPSQGQCGWAGGCSSRLAAHPEGRTLLLATPGPGLVAAPVYCFSCCQRIFLGTNDSAA